MLCHVMDGYHPPLVGLGHITPHPTSLHLPPPLPSTCPPSPPPCLPPSPPLPHVVGCARALNDGGHGRARRPVRAGVAGQQADDPVGVGLLVAHVLGGHVVAAAAARQRLGGRGAQGSGGGRCVSGWVEEGGMQQGAHHPALHDPGRQTPAAPPPPAATPTNRPNRCNRPDRSNRQPHQLPPAPCRTAPPPRLAWASRRCRRPRAAASRRAGAGAGRRRHAGRLW